ncbi:hypothetical protein GIB67_002952, partial [Kingdonia uniflora]
MQMSEGEPHPSTLPGFRGRRDPERFVTFSRSERKKKRVEFEDVQPQDIPNPTEDNFPQKYITQLPDGVSHIYYTGNELTNRDSMRVHGTFTSVLKVWKDIATLPAVRDAVVPYDDAWSILSNTWQLLPNIDSSHIKSGNVSIAHFKMYLTVEINQEDDITIARAFILFMMGHLCFQTANDTFPLGYLAAVNDLDLAAQFDWGSAILASLYHGLDTAYWFYEYCGVGHPIVKEDVKYHIDHRTVETITWEPWFDSTVSETEDVLNAKLLSRKRIALQVPNENYKYYLGDKCWRQVIGEVRIPLDPPLSMSPHISPATLHEMRQAGFVDYSQRMGNLDLFGPSALRAGIIPVVVTSASVHSLSQDFSLPGEAEGPDLGWHMQWIGRRENHPIARLRDPPPMSSSYGTEELWHLSH